ncbi:MAG: adenylate kinase [Dehalococcoidia bacterium]|nr:adenylate kinase [Dehalococcoidia bacterium]
MNIILLGAPGAGKGTQAVVLVKEKKMAHVASGDLFREAQKSGTELGNLAKSYMEKGELVPDEVTVKMVLERIAKPDCANGFLLDGFPRTIPQAEALDKALSSQNKAIDKAVYIYVPEEDLIKRLSGRWICRKCQAPFHLVDAPPKVVGKCDHCGGELYQRADDNEKTVRNRLEVYLKQTSPLIDYYAKAAKLLKVNGKQSVNDVSKEMLAALA